MIGGTNAQSVKTGEGHPSGTNIYWYQRGNVVNVEILGVAVEAGWSNHLLGSGLPKPVHASAGVNHNFYLSASQGQIGCLMFITEAGTINANSTVTTTVYGTTTYLTDA